jgi:energy-coupling factor transport system permease protein
VLDPVTPAVLYVLVAGAVLVGAGVRPRALLVAQLPFVAFALGVLLVNMLSRPGEVVWQGAGLRVTAEGLWVGAGLAGRTLLMGLLSVAFVATTDGVALVTSLHQHARLGAKVTFAVLAGYRLLQQMGAEWQTIRRAQSVRAPLGRRGRPRVGLRGHAASAFALLVGSVRRGDRVAGTLELRGLGDGDRTTWRPVPLDRRDAAFAGAVLGVLGVVLVGASATGVLEGPGALF